MADKRDAGLDAFKTNQEEKKIDTKRIMRVGIIGTGWIAGAHMSQYVKMPDVKIVAAADLIPGKADRREINRVIFQELCRGTISPDSKALFLRVLEDLRTAGAEGAILGCTEIGLLIGQNDTDLPLFDTTQIHAQAAAELALTDC